MQYYIKFTPKNYFFKKTLAKYYNIWYDYVTQRDELCEDCRSVRLAFCRRCLNSERWENGRIFAFLLPWRWRQRRRTNSKACPQHAGKAETRECRMQNAECRIKNARIVFTLAMATILRRRIAWMENIKKLWEKRNEIVKPVIAWSVFGGTLAVAIALALIFWLWYFVFDRADLRVWFGNKN